MSQTDPRLSSIQRAHSAIAATEILRKWLTLHDAASSTEPENDETVSCCSENWKEDAWFQQQGQSEPDTEAGEIETALSRMDTIMAILDSYHHGRLKERVALLKNLADEEIPETEPLSITSVENFAQFLGSCPPLRCPNLVLTPQGNIRAKWKNINKKHFIALEFLNDSNVKFVVSTPDPRHTYKTIRAAGLATIDSAVDILRPYGLKPMLLDPNS